MVEDAATKDVFRECDGFLVLINVVSMLRDDALSASVESSEAARLAFAILSEAMSLHQANKDYFEVNAFANTCHSI